MRLSRSLQYLSVLFCCLCSACSRVVPAHFWVDYKEDLIVRKNIDNGPWGGRSHIYWKAPVAHTFIGKDVIDLAGRNDWAFVDSIAVSAETLQAWGSIHEPIFPIPFEGFPTGEINTRETYRLIPRSINTAATIYSFDSRLALIGNYPDGGGEASTNRNSFVLLSADGNEMEVFNAWGE